MYGNMVCNASIAALSDWYMLYLVSGEGHCSDNSVQPNGPPG
ncbi:hypothetical protein Vi05172_g11381 [Venturia inaequalis]|nr:hypothetical protein Vi05172_g11381 [Venturia inaequalis]